MMLNTVKQIAWMAGISVRTLHYYDQVGLLKPQSRNQSGYRLYAEKDWLTLQQILFFRELGFSLQEIRQIISRPGFDVIEALQSQRALLEKKAQRIAQLITTVDKTIQQLKGEKSMEIKEYYNGFSEEQIEKYRQEVRQRWGDKTLQDSEERVTKMGKVKFNQLQAEGQRIFQDIAANMLKGAESPRVQELVIAWREWLEHFSHYSDEAALELGRIYSQNPEFASYYCQINPDLPGFLTKAIEFHYSRLNSHTLRSL